MNAKTGVLTLGFIWNIRLKLYAEGSKLKDEGRKLRAEGSRLYAEGGRLWDEGNKLRAEGSRLYAEGGRLRAEGDKLWAEGSKLRAEGDKLWAEAILEAYGNITLEWVWDAKNNNYECHLGNGEIYSFKEEK